MEEEGLTLILILGCYSVKSGNSSTDQGKVEEEEEVKEEEKEEKEGVVKEEESGFQNIVSE